MISDHVASDIECTSPHAIVPGDDGEPCILCDVCGRFVRPHRMGAQCPGPDPRTLAERMTEMREEMRVALRRQYELHGDG